MKQALVTIFTACLVMSFSVATLAGDYHTGSTLKCYQCHVSHTSDSHTYTDDNADAYISSGDPAAHMLKQADVTALCLSCHDGAGAVDVYGATQGGQPMHRSAGCFNGDASGPYSPFSSTNGHNLKGGGDTPPGGSGSYNLDCVSCHDPHGNNYYRNLKDLGNGGITYAKIANDTSKDVFELKPYPNNLVADAYDASSISYNAPNGGVSHMEGFCVSCHTNIHTASPQSGSWTKHPSVGYSKPYTTGTVSPLKTLGGTPVAGGSGTLVAGQVSCVTCHKAHGSTHPFGLIYDNRTTTDIEDSTTSESVQVTCKHCHEQGLTATE
jgi:hypothetical protein